MKNRNDMWKKGIILMIAGVLLLIVLTMQIRMMFGSSWGPSATNLLFTVIYGLGGAAQIYAGKELVRGRRLEFQFNYVVNVLVGFNLVIVYWTFGYSIFSLIFIAFAILAGLYYWYEFRRADR